MNILLSLQAQESGEQYEIQDNVVYALDGLTCSASPAVRQESAAKIAEVCASQRGRLALRQVPHASILPAVSCWIDTHAESWGTRVYQICRGALHNKCSSDMCAGLMD